MSKILIYDVFYEFRDLMKSYPANFFNNFQYQFILKLMPVYFVATLIVPIFNGEIPIYLFEQILFILLLILFLSFGIYFMWKFGLKKYEVFR